MRTSAQFNEECARIGEEFGARINDGGRVAMVIATVSAVDEENRTFDAVVDNDRFFSGMNLDIFPNGGNSIFFIPEVDSLVVLGFIEGFSEVPILLKTTKLSKIIISNVAGTEEQSESIISFDKDIIEIIRGTSNWKIEKNKISFTSDAIEMDGGENGGLVLIKELTDSINNFVSQVGNMCTTFNTHTHGAQGAAPPASPMQAPTSLNQSDYENTKITQ